MSGTRRTDLEKQVKDLPKMEEEVQSLLENTTPQVIGARLKRYRQRQGLSIRDLATKAEVSTNSVLRIESGGTMHSLTILKICIALGLHVVRLSDPENLEPDGTAALHTKQDDRWFELTDLGSGPLAPGPLSKAERTEIVKSGKADNPLLILQSRLETGRIQPTVIELFEQSETRSHAGEEFLYVMSGIAEITIGGKSYRLEEGESITFWSSEEHSYAPNKDSELPTRLLCVQVSDRPGP